MTEEITNLLFANGADFGGDLMARNIQRGRDHGIPGFCCYYQLHVDSNFDCDKGWNDKYEGISQDNWNLLRTIHARPSDIDLWTGGLAQDPFNGGLTGQVLQQMKCKFLILSTWMLLEWQGTHPKTSHLWCNETLIGRNHTFYTIFSRYIL